MMEIRVVDINLTGNGSTVFASYRRRGKIAFIPAIFLDPNFNNNSRIMNSNNSRE